MKGFLNASFVSSLAWIPGSEAEFMVAFANGKILGFDKDREDKAMEENIEVTEYQN